MNPGYPDEMSDLSVNGTVSVEATVDAHGRITHVRAIDAKSNAFFGALAERALSYWTFAPATRGGVPVSYQFIMPVKFEMLN